MPTPTGENIPTPMVRKMTLEESRVAFNRPVSRYGESVWGGIIWRMTQPFFWGKMVRGVIRAMQLHGSGFYPMDYVRIAGSSLRLILKVTCSGFCIGEIIHIAIYE